MFGVLPIDKPPGKTSRDVVNVVQRLVRPIKVGHTGTLDPLATGVLLVVVGNATRLVEFAHDLPKVYDAEFLLGKRSDTLDTDGTVTDLPEESRLTRQDWVAESRKWIGRVQQVPLVIRRFKSMGKGPTRWRAAVVRSNCPAARS